MSIYDERALMKEEKRKRDEVKSFLYKSLFENHADPFYMLICKSLNLNLTSEIKVFFTDGAFTIFEVPFNIQDYNFETLILEILRDKLNYNTSLIQSSSYPFKEMLSFEKLFLLDIEALEKLKEIGFVVHFDIYFKKTNVSAIAMYSLFGTCFKIKPEYITDLLKIESGRKVYLYGISDIKYPNLLKHILHNDIFDATPEEELYLELR